MSVNTAPAGDPYEAIVSFAMPANVETRERNATPVPDLASLNPG